LQLVSSARCRTTSPIGSRVRETRKGLAWMPLLTAGGLSRWLAQVPDPSRLLQPIARRRLAAVAAVEGEPALQLGDVGLQPCNQLPQRGDLLVHLFCRPLARARPERAGPAGRPAGAAAAPRRPTRSRRALAAADCRRFRFQFCGCGSGMALSGSGRALMRPPGSASHGVGFASTPLATALTLLSFSPSSPSFGGLARARGQSELGLQVDPPAPPLRRADRLARAALWLPPTVADSVFSFAVADLGWRSRVRGARS
jgi:hypothetical protein